MSPEKLTVLSPGLVCESGKGEHLLFGCYVEITGHGSSHGVAWPPCGQILFTGSRPTDTAELRGGKTQAPEDIWHRGSARHVHSANTVDTEVFTE